MTQSKPRLLLNAEPFGFGPAAAIACLTPLLQERGMQISYIGETHTLDLQKHLAYEAMYDTTSMTSHEKRILMNQLATRYDLFVTAMDFSMAEIAEAAAMPTVIYDALTWYWPQIHPAIKHADLYIAQQFFGVQERLALEASAFPAYAVVPPIVAANEGAEKQHVLLNMGGLQNPYWDFHDAVAYAQLMLNAVSAALPETETLIVTTSATIAKALHDPRVSTLSRQSMIDALRRAKTAIMTPGLGNIYDAASFNVPTLWLPPANDSQGQQSMLLAENGCCDESLDWSELTGAIDYRAPQTVVVQAITHALQAVTHSKNLRQQLSRLSSQKFQALSTHQNSNAKNLLQLFGSDGAIDIASAIAQHVESRTYVGTK
ncbi:MAG: hypothetical protein JWN38_318 [Candidatus Saccharibacteria bacterium]|nr:hypothetical protein [Candidatus Saccharibacteria bacterium]